jgi:hypothetical protein
MTVIVHVHPEAAGSGTAQKLPMRDASLVSFRYAPCVVDPLSMTAGELLAGAHAACAGWVTQSDGRRAEGKLQVCPTYP